jgi:hypothetical protein
VAAWQINQHTYELGYAELNAVDALANSLEDRWGRGRLRLLAPDELRIKFDRQRALLNNAEWNGGIDDLRLQCARMCNAWRAVEKAALAAGHFFGDKRWRAAMPNGQTLVLVGDSEATHRYVKRSEDETVWSLEELAHLVAAQDDVVKAIKAQFAGATVIAAEKVDPVAAVKKRASEFVEDDGIPF